MGTLGGVLYGAPCTSEHAICDSHAVFLVSPGVDLVNRDISALTNSKYVKKGDDFLVSWGDFNQFFASEV